MERQKETGCFLPRFDGNGRPVEQFEIGILYTVINKGNYLVCLRPGEREEIKPAFICALKVTD